MIRDVEIQVGNGTALPANNDTGLVSLCLAKTTAALLKLLALKRIQARATTRWVAAFVEQLQQGADAAAAGGGIFMPQSALSFTVGCLLALTEIKSNGDSKFPFLSHPYSVKIAITSILIYAFVSAIEQHMIVSANAPPVNQPPNAYKVIVSCGRIASLAILVGALASFFIL